jgi:hypothetical protein
LERCTGAAFAEAHSVINKPNTKPKTKTDRIAFCSLTVVRLASASAVSRTITPCNRAPAHSLLAKNRRIYAGDFPSAYNGTTGKHHVQTHKTACQDAPVAQAATARGGRGLGRCRHLFIAGTTLNRR